MVLGEQFLWPWQTVRRITSETTKVRDFLRKVPDFSKKVPHFLPSHHGAGNCTTATALPYIPWFINRLLARREPIEDALGDGAGDLGATLGVERFAATVRVGQEIGLYKDGGDFGRAGYREIGMERVAGRKPRGDGLRKPLPEVVPAVDGTVAPRRAIRPPPALPSPP